MPAARRDLDRTVRGRAARRSPGGRLWPKKPWGGARTSGNTGRIGRRVVQGDLDHLIHRAATVGVPLRWSTRTPIWTRKSSIPIAPRSSFAPLNRGSPRSWPWALRPNRARRRRHWPRRGHRYSRRSAFSPTTRLRRRPAIGIASSNWSPGRGSWRSARRGWIVTGTTRRSRCSRTISIGICDSRSNKICRSSYTRVKATTMCWRCCAARRRGPLRSDALVYRHRRNGGRMRRPGALYQLCRHGHVQEVQRFAGRGRDRSGGSHPGRNRQPVLVARSRGGRRNEPAHLVHTARCLAAVRRQNDGDFFAQTTANARALFRLPP